MKHSKSSVDFKEVAALALDRAETLVPQWLPGGKRSGAEWVCGSFQGEPGRSLSVNLNTGKWSDFSLEGKGTAGGDLVSLLAAIRGCTQKEAAAEIDPSLTFSLNGNGHRSQSAQSARKPSPEWVPIIPVPDHAPEPPEWLFAHKEHGPAVASWPYRTRDKGLIGCIIRFNQADGGKEFRPATWCDGPDGKQEWRAKAFPEPRPLYGLEFLHREGSVYLVEGEKSADALRRMLPDACVLSWPGGSNAVSKADWSPLAGREVVIWPDADEPGTKAALAIQQRIPRAHIVKPVPGKPEGWDAADAEAEGWTADDAREFLARPAVPEQDPDRAPVTDRHYSLPFRMLGMAGGRYFYLPDSGLTVVELSASGHVKLNLMQLAPLQDWEAEFPKKSGADWDAAANALMQRNANLPEFDSSRRRGRGCWIDGGDIVFHAGGHLAVNGVDVDIRHYRSPSGAIYERGLNIPTHDGAPAGNLDGVRLRELCSLLSWDRPVSGVLLAGWLALAPVCGALGWRPHLWVTGPSGSGKSWIASNIIAPMTEGICLPVQGNSTEAGIRGSLRSDALAVVFDEAESEDAAGIARKEKILELARQSSSESGGGIVKGTASGGFTSYRVRSMFLFLSIGVAAVKKADTSRISILELRKSNDRGNFERIKQLAAETVRRPEWAASIRARSLTNAITIRSNAEVFSAAAVEFTGDKRSADQIGTLMAGAWSLTSTSPVTPETARDYLARQDWNEHRSDPEDSDENQCYSHLMTCLLTPEPGEKITVGELVDMAARGESNAPDVLKRYGLKVQDGRLWVANVHTQLGILFRDTPWAGGKWKQQFARMAGAEKMDTSRFGPACKQKSVSIPLGD